MLDPGEHYGGYSRAPRGPPHWIGSPHFNPMMDPPPLRSTPIPHQLDRVPMSLAGNGGYPMGYAHPSGENGSEAGMVGLNRMFNPMEGPRRVPPPFLVPPLLLNLHRTAEAVCTLNLPIVSHPTERREIPANTQAMLVRSADGVFLRLSNGLLLNAQNSVFDSVSNRVPPLITIQPDPPRPLRLPPPLNSVPDVIELD
ncbi:hypothetical protein OSTOST_17901 [Ostertagia ostertagi]